MGERPNIADRTDQDITDDVVACLNIVGPEWVGWMDPSFLPLHVRDQLDEFEREAREHGTCGSGCMEVRYDADERKMTWSVVVGVRFDDSDDEDNTSPSEADRG
jgi:hypothetical protein